MLFRRFVKPGVVMVRFCILGCGLGPLFGNTIPSKMLTNNMDTRYKKKGETINMQTNTKT
jgi:hypothetical protein